MKEIKLSQCGKHKNKFIALVDNEDFEEQNQYKWFVLRKKYTCYAARCIKINNKTKTILLHRAIMNTPDDLQVDHWDHNGLNCQRYNMRNCTNRENQSNRLNYNNRIIHIRHNYIIKYKYKYKGITLIKRKYKNKEYRYFQTYINHNNKYTYIGCFKTKEDAARAYDIAAKKAYGEFANLNFK